jgi:hypothetical protein
MAQIERQFGAFKTREERQAANDSASGATLT